MQFENPAGTKTRAQIRREDLTLGKILLDNKVVTKEEIHECLRLQKKVRGEVGMNLLLGELLVSRGHIDEDTLEGILKVQAAKMEIMCERLAWREKSKEMGPRHDVWLGKLAIQNQLIVEEQLEEVLAVQKRAHGVGVQKRLGEILVERKMLSYQALEGLLQIQEGRDRRREAKQAPAPMDAGQMLRRQQGKRRSRRVPDDMFLGLVREYRFMTREALRECRHLQQQMKAVGVSRSLASIALDRNLVARKTLASLQEVWGVRLAAQRRGKPGRRKQSSTAAPMAMAAAVLLLVLGTMVVLFGYPGYLVWWSESQGAVPAIVADTAQSADQSGRKGAEVSPLRQALQNKAPSRQPDPEREAIRSSERKTEVLLKTVRTKADFAEYSRRHFADQEQFLNVALCPIGSPERPSALVAHGVCTLPQAEWANFTLYWFGQQQPVNRVRARIEQGTFYAAFGDVGGRMIVPPGKYFLMVEVEAPAPGGATGRSRGTLSNTGGVQDGEAVSETLAANIWPTPRRSFGLEVGGEGSLEREHRAIAKELQRKMEDLATHVDSVETLHRAMMEKGAALDRLDGELGAILRQQAEVRHWAEQACSRYLASPVPGLFERLSQLCVSAERYVKVLGLDLYARSGRPAPIAYRRGVTRDPQGLVFPSPAEVREKWSCLLEEVRSQLGRAEPYRGDQLYSALCADYLLHEAERRLRGVTKTIAEGFLPRFQGADSAVWAQWWDEWAEGMLHLDRTSSAREFWTGRLEAVQPVITEVVGVVASRLVEVGSLNGGEGVDRMVRWVTNVHRDDEQLRAELRRVAARFGIEDLGL